MKKIIVTFLFMITISGCTGTSIFVGAGHNLNRDHVGSNPVAIFGVNQQITDEVTCGWLHVSNVFDGKPFNSKEEKVSDIAHCGYEYRFK